MQTSAVIEDISRTIFDEDDEYSEKKFRKRSKKIRNNRNHQLNIRWLKQNYTVTAQCYNSKLNSSDYNSNRNSKVSSTSPVSDIVKMASRGANSKSSANNANLHNRKMFNNFLDSLDIASNAQVNTSAQMNTGYQNRNKSGTNHGSKLHAHQSQAMRQIHNNTVHGTSANMNTVNGKRNKQLVSTSYNMAPA